MASARAAGQALRLTRARKVRATLSKFKALFASPQSLGSIANGQTSSTLAVPANCQIGVSHSAGCTAGQLRVNIGPTKKMGVPALAANQEYTPGVEVERGKTVSVTHLGAGPGTVKLWVSDGLSKDKAFATVTFT